MRVIGVDGCRGGWICIALRCADDPSPQWWVSAEFEEILARWPTADRVLVDIPVGLLDAGPERRSPDVLARRALGGKRASSVFNAPIRPVLDAPDYAAANARSRRLTGRGLSRQSWAIVPKIRQVDRLLRSRPEWIGRVREVHPDLSFQAFAVDALAAALTGVGGAPLRTIPETPERDAAGIPMEMVFAG